MAKFRFSLSNALLMVFICKGYSMHKPDHITACSRSDPNFEKCATEAANRAIPTIAQGVKAFGVPSLKPYKLESLTFNSSNFQLKLINIEIFGMDNLHFTNMKMFNNFTKGEIEAENENVTYKSNYELNGKISIFNLNSTGRAEISLTKPKIYYSFDLHIFQKNKVDYGKFVNTKLNYKLKRMKTFFENIFRGNELLSKEINAVINDNWQEFEKEFHEVMVLFVRKLVDFYNNAYFTKIPINELIVP